MAVQAHKKEQAAAAAADPPAGTTHHDDSPPPPMHPGAHAPSAAVPGDPLAMSPYIDDFVQPHLPDAHVAPQTAEKKLNDQLADMKAAAYTTELMVESGGVDGRGHHAFLNTLDKIDDPLVRAKVKEKYEAFTNQKLDDFIAHANWAGSRDKDQALDLISGDRDAAESKIAAMTPKRKARLHADASRWAEQVLAATNIEDANDDDNAKKIARVLGPRSEEEIEAIRAAIRQNTHGQHTIYEELDRALSKGNEDEAVAGLKGDPVHAAQVGLANAGGDPTRVKELLRGLKGTQIIELHKRNPMITAWVGALVGDGADRREIEALVEGRKDKADGERVANLLQEPGRDGKVNGTKLDGTTERNLEDRKPANIIRELEGKSPAELIAAEQAWDSDPAHAGHSFKAMIEARFGSEPSTDKLRIEALLRGDRAADKVYALREGMRNHNQGEIEEALTNPDLRSNDPAKKAAADKERREIVKRAEQFDEIDQRVVAMATGTDASGASGRSVAQQIEANYKDAVDHPKVEGSIFERATIMASPDANKDKREDKASDNRIATSEVLGTGALSTETQIYRADKKGDTKGEAQLLDGLKTNGELGNVGARFEAKYHKTMLEAPSLAKFEYLAQVAKKDGDDRPISDIERDMAREDMSATALQIENVRQYGVKAERRHDVEERLQDELENKQHSGALANREKLRQLEGGNEGTEALGQEQHATLDDMLEPAKDPLGVLPRELKAGVTEAEFHEIDQNLTSTLDVQRDEKTKLANHVARIFTTIAKIAALAAGQPELVAAIDVLSGLAAMAIKKQIAGEAYDPTDDAKMLAVTTAVDLATVGISRVGGAAKAGEETAAEAVEQGVATEATEEIVHGGASVVAGEAGVAETEIATEAEQTALATTGSTEQALAGEAEQAAGEGWQTAANLGVASAGTVASGMIQGKSPTEILGDVIKGGFTMFLPAALGRRMQQAVGDASKARVILGEIASIGTEFTTNYGINGSVEEAVTMTTGTRIHTYATGGWPRLPTEGPTGIPDAQLQLPAGEPLALPAPSSAADSEQTSPADAADLPSTAQRVADGASDPSGRAQRVAEQGHPDELRGVEAQQDVEDAQLALQQQPAAAVANGGASATLLVVNGEVANDQGRAAASAESGGRSGDRPKVGGVLTSEPAADPSASAAAASGPRPRNNREVREQYNASLRRIAELDAEWKQQGLSAEERARRASEIRHDARMVGRAAMDHDGQKLRLLVRDAQKYGDGGGPTFDQLVDMQHERGVEGDAGYEAIVDGSQRSDPETNARAARSEAPKTNIALPPGTTVQGDRVIVTGMNKKPLDVRIKRRDAPGPAEIERQPDGTFHLSIGQDVPIDEALSQVARELARMAETPRQNLDDLDGLYQEAGVAQNDLGELTRGVAGELEGEPLVPEKLKGRERTQEKIAADYKGENARIIDLARSSIVFETPEQVQDAIARIKERAEVVRMKDRFAAPENGYRDVVMTVRMPNGHLVEVQLHLRRILDVKNGPGHALYEQIRTIDARATLEGRSRTDQETATVDGLKKEMKRLYDEAFNATEGPGPEQTPDDGGEIE